VRAEARIDAAWFRHVVEEATDADPGELDGTERLDAIGVKGVDRLLVLAAVETVMDVEFPHDLEPALETVADFLYYVRVKLDQAASRPTG
jgi:hypothetical protein